MRNLKKLLALVLAMVMAFSLMLTASAVDYKDYPDKDSITEEFDEAVRVLTGLKVMQGDEKGFRPGDTITRAEAAAIIYRIATGDVDDNQVKIYADYGTFTDVKHDDWFAGYVGYCQNAGYIKGTTPTTFNPYGKVTGYEALAMILRVVGYGKNNEFTGGQWQVNVASMSKQLGVTDNVKNANFETTLNFAARRDVVADLMFQTMTKVPTVTYTPALAYNDKVSTIGEEFNPTLGEKTFGLWKGYLVNDANEEIVDMWGRPGYYWLKDGTKQGVDSSTHKPIYRSYDANGRITFGTETAPYVFSKMVAVITEKPALTYTKTIRECDLAHDFPFSTTKDFSLYVNSDEHITDAYHVEATDTVTKVGGQGRLVEVYKKNSDHSDDRVVMIDTYLAQVTKVTTAVLDPQGHVVVPAQLTVNVYDDTSAKNTPNDHVIVKGLTSAENWEYAVGDYLLVNAWTDWREGDAANANPANVLNHDPETTDQYPTGTAFNPTTILERNNKAAFEPNIVDSFVGGGINEVLIIDATAQIVGKADSFTGAQTSITWNTGKHNVGNQDYDDAFLFYLDKAQRTTGTSFTWFKDQYGNLIGVVDARPVNFGVITSLYSSFGQGDADTDGNAKVYAKVKMADDSEATLEISKFLVSTVAGGVTGHANAGTQLTAAANTADLIPVYDYGNSNNVMQAFDTNRTQGTSYDHYGYLNVAPVASVNATAENLQNAPQYFGIIKANMFKFVPGSDNTYTAVEVAGAANNTAADFLNLRNATAGTGARQGSLVKNLGMVASHDYNGTTQTGGATVWVDNDTKIMLKKGTSASASIVAYDGLSAVPGNITLVSGSEIDWADTDGDGRAEYLYIVGEVNGAVTYGLFYYNGGVATWNGNEQTGTGTIQGWLNGEATTVSFDDYTEFRTVRDSQAYAGHLFGLQFTDDVVSNVMVQNDNNSQPYLLYDYGTPGNTDNNSIITPGNGFGASPGISLNSTAAPRTYFGLGSVNSAFKNPYTANTRAYYWNDQYTGGINVWYDAASGKVVRGGTQGNASTMDVNGGAGVTYQVGPNTKVIGLGGGTAVAEGEAALYYLNRSVRNDVTIVYENNAARSIVEIYVSTDPNYTPGTVGTTYQASLAVGNTGILTLNVNDSGANSSTASYNAKIYSYSVGDSRVNAVKVADFNDALVAGTKTNNGTQTLVTSASRYVYFYAEVTIGGQTITTNTVIGNQ